MIFCEDCKFYAPSSEFFGKCCRRAPMASNVVPDRDWRDSEDQYPTFKERAAVWPIVAAYDGCGEGEKDRKA